MVKLKIGLYKDKETGQFDVIINQIDNIMKVHNEKFKLVQEFIHIEKTKEDILREELTYLKSSLELKIDDWLIPVFKKGKNSYFLDDKKINELREELYNFMCKRRELLKIN